MTVPNHTLQAILGDKISMTCKEIGNFSFNSLGQELASTLA